MKAKKKASASRDMLATSCVVYRPNTGQQAKRENFVDLRKKYEKTDFDTARYHWERQHDESSEKCLHEYMSVTQ